MAYFEFADFDPNDFDTGNISSISTNKMIKKLIAAGMIVLAGILLLGVV